MHLTLYVLPYLTYKRGLARYTRDVYVVKSKASKRPRVDWRNHVPGPSWYGISVDGEWKSA